MVKLIGNNDAEGIKQTYIEIQNKLNLENNFKLRI